VKEALRRLTASLGIARKLGEYEVITSWEELVGEQIARVTKPERIERGILVVSVDSAPWRTELSMRRLEIVEHINHAVGRRVIKEIRFR
jgi:predicted nucleic acid-binding Zn ribbon protein